MIYFFRMYIHVIKGQFIKIPITAFSKAYKQAALSTAQKKM